MRLSPRLTPTWKIPKWTSTRRPSAVSRASGPAWRGAARALLSPGFQCWTACRPRRPRASSIGFLSNDSAGVCATSVCTAIGSTPTKPFAETLIGAADGAAITSATLRDTAVETAATWSAAEIRTGAQHLALPATRLSLPSPFDHAAQTRIFVATDVGRDDAPAVASAVRDLFLAAHGGGLGLFTSIARLRAVHGRIARDLADAGLTLLAQHVDGMDAGTLVDIFRADRDSCLLGTDAVRDGVDVPGRALHLIVFDRVPWPRPDILHRARREHFGGGYDNILTRLRLKQAYGRLIRRADDHGVFVMLDSRLPSRLCSAFPEGVAVERLPLAEVVARTGDFISGFPVT